MPRALSCPKSVFGKESEYWIQNCIDRTGQLVPQQRPVLPTCLVPHLQWGVGLVGLCAPLSLSEELPTEPQAVGFVGRTLALGTEQQLILLNGHQS